MKFRVTAHENVSRIVELEADSPEEVIAGVALGKGTEVARNVVSMQYIPTAIPAPPPAPKE